MTTEDKIKIEAILDNVVEQADIDYWSLADFQENLINDKIKYRRDVNEEGQNIAVGELHIGLSLFEQISSTFKLYYKENAEQNDNSKYIKKLMHFILKDAILTKDITQEIVIDYDGELNESTITHLQDRIFNQLLAEIQIAINTFGTMLSQAVNVMNDFSLLLDNDITDVD